MDLRLDNYLLRYNRFINFIGVGLCRTSVVWRPLWWVVLPPFLGYQIDLPFQSSLFCTERNKRAKKFYFRRKLIFARYFFLYRIMRFANLADQKYAEAVFKPTIQQEKTCYTTLKAKTTLSPRCLKRPAASKPSRNLPDSSVVNYCLTRPLLVREATPDMYILFTL